MTADRDRVRDLLGREPQGQYTVVVRDDDGDPIVIRNAPLLDDGTPMPTRFWLVGRNEVAAVSRLEAAGGVRAAEAAVDAGELGAAHERYAAERDADLPADAQPRPSGGVGGTRLGVKCLHAHYAWFLAGGDDPVGRWTARQLNDRLTLEITDDALLVHHGTGSVALQATPAELVGELTSGDPPAPQNLTNTIGSVTDDLDNLLRTRADIAEAGSLDVLGDEAWHLAVVERGAEPDASTTTLTASREALEDLFRTLAVEPRHDRLHNPGLQPPRVDSVLAACCAVLAVMRRLQFGDAAFRRDVDGNHSAAPGPP